MPKKQIKFLAMVLLICTTIFSHIFRIYLGGIAVYIINPFIWIIQAFLIFILIGYKYRKYFKFEINIALIVCILAIIYNILFYFLGLVVGFAKNPLSNTFNGITINLFSSVGTIIAVEYVKSIHVNVLHNIKKWRNLIILFIIFVLVDINLLFFINSLNHFTNIADFLVKELIPISCTTALTMYLAYVSGSKSAIFYKTFIIIPTIIIPGLPNVNIIILVILKVGMALLTFLVIQLYIDKSMKKTFKKISIEFNPRNMFINLALLLLIVTFTIGIFPIAPASIVTNSMKPTINKGDIVLVQKCDIDDIEINDIIQYKLNSYTVVHRVMSIDNLGGYKVFTTKGDNNYSIDKKVVQENQIIGKIKFKIPFLGYPTYLIKTIFNTNGNIEVETGVD